MPGDEMLVAKITVLENKVLTLESQWHRLVLDQHNLEKQLITITSDLGYIRKTQDTITSSLSKILWTFGGAIVVAVATFILKGGLSVIAQ